MAHDLLTRAGERRRHGNGSPCRFQATVANQAPIKKTRDRGSIVARRHAAVTNEEDDGAIDRARGRTMWGASSESSANGRREHMERPDDKTKARLTLDRGQRRKESGRSSKLLPSGSRDGARRSRVAALVAAPCALLIIAAFGACGPQSGKVDASEPIAECDAYVAAEQHCFPGVASNMSIQRAVRTATSDADRQRLRERCSTATTSLQAACR